MAQGKRLYISQVCCCFWLADCFANLFLNFDVHMYNVRYTSFYSEEFLIIHQIKLKNGAKPNMTREKSFYNQAFVVQCNLSILGSECRACLHLKVLDRARL